MNWNKSCYFSGFPLRRDRCDPTERAPDSRCDGWAVRQAIAAAGRLFGKLVFAANRRAPVFFVVAAGNDSGPSLAPGERWCADPSLPTGLGDFPAELASPMTWAAQRMVGLAEHVLVVEALDRVEGWDARRATMSNVSGGGVAAPGDRVGVLQGGGASSGYAMVGGTSYATPLVTGAAAYLLAVQPNLTNAELRERLTSASTTQPVDGGGSTTERGLDVYAALLGIDRLRGDDRVRRLFANLDDGSRDGSQRVVYDGDGLPLACLTHDRPVDETIDLRDFRRLRDGLLLEARLPLDGVGNPKRDLNEDGQQGADELEPFPRAGLNGDAWLDDFPRPLAGGWPQDRSLIEELFTFDLRQPWPAAALRGLLRSADLHVDARCAFYGEEVDEVLLRLSGQALGLDPQPVDLSPLDALRLDEDAGVLTTPLRGQPTLRWQAWRDGAPAGEEQTLRLADLQPGEDRPTRLDPPVTVVEYDAVTAVDDAEPIRQRVAQRFVVRPGQPGAGDPCQGGGAAQRPELEAIQVRKQTATAEGPVTTLEVWSTTSSPAIYVIDPPGRDPYSGLPAILKYPLQVPDDSWVLPIAPSLSRLLLRCGRYQGETWEQCLADEGYVTPALLPEGPRELVDERPCLVVELAAEGARLQLCLSLECATRRLLLPLRYEVQAAGQHTRMELHDLQVMADDPGPWRVPGGCRSWPQIPFVEFCDPL